MLNQEFCLPCELKLPAQSQGIFTAIHLNVRSAATKLDELSTFFNAFKFMFDVIMLTETWYHEGSDMLNMIEYNHYFINRSDRRGGGVAMHVKSTYSVT